jgi:glutamate N-acetyltransferase/amino-acid N-acetyltransferase
VLIEIAEGSQTAAVFTQNAFSAAPVVISKKHLSQSQPRYLLVNTGNANAGTGEQGLADALACCDLVAKVSNSKSFETLPFSTGVI